MILNEFIKIKIILFQYFINKINFLNIFYKIIGITMGPLHIYLLLYQNI